MTDRILAPLAFALALAAPISAMPQTITPDDTSECVAAVDGNGARVGRLDGGALVVDGGDFAGRVFLFEPGFYEFGSLYFPASPSGCICSEPSALDAWVGTGGNLFVPRQPFGYDAETSTFYFEDRTVPIEERTFGCRLDLRTDSCETGSWTLDRARPVTAHQLSGFVPPFHAEAEACAGPAAASIDTLGLVAVASLMLLTGARLLLAREVRLRHTRSQP